MTTDQRTQVWNSLRDKEYREHFTKNIGVGLAFQIRLLREKYGWTQEELAQRAGKRQETISQWEDPNYGRFTLNTLKDLATAFDVALVVRFAPFSELVDWEMNLTPEHLAPSSYEEERVQRPTVTVSGNLAAAEESYNRKYQEQLEGMVQEQADRLQNQFAQLVQSLAREHASLLALQGARGSKETEPALTNLPPELQKPAGFVDDFARALLQVIRRRGLAGDSREGRP